MEERPAANLRSRQDLGEILGYAWRIYLSNFGALFAIAAVTAPLQMLHAVIARRIDGENARAGIDLLFLAPELLTALVAAGALIAAVHTISGSTRAETLPALDAAFERFGALVSTGLLQFGLAFASVFAAPVLALYWVFNRDATIDGERNWWLAIVPFALTVYLGVRWGFAQQAIMIEGKQRWAALDASAQVVRHQWWRAFGILLLIVLITLGPSLAAESARAAPALVAATVTSVVAALFLPFLVAAQTLLYYDLKARNSVDHNAAVDAPGSDLQG